MLLLIFQSEPHQTRGAALSISPGKASQQVHPPTQTRHFAFSRWEPELVCPFRRCRQLRLPHAVREASYYFWKLKKKKKKDQQMFTSNNHCRKQPAQGTCCLIASSALLTRSSLTCSSTCVSLPVRRNSLSNHFSFCKHRPSTLVPLQMSIAPFAPVNLIGGQSSNKIIYNMHGILMNIVIVHLDYYTSHLQHGSHQT